MHADIIFPTTGLANKDALRELVSKLDSELSDDDRGAGHEDRGSVSSHPPYGRQKLRCLTVTALLSAPAWWLTAMAECLDAEGMRTHIHGGELFVIEPKRPAPQPTEALHSSPTVRPSSHGTISARTVGGESSPDVDLTACECGGDTAHDLTDFAEFRTCRCCCSCSAPDSASVDIRAMSDGPEDVEPYCVPCALVAVVRMLNNRWTPESFEVRPLPLSDRMLRLGVAA